jgi:hypothetical protein
MLIIKKLSGYPPCMGQKPKLDLYLTHGKRYHKTLGVLHDDNQKLSG